jgi:hypothetical protein
MVDHVCEPISSTGLASSRLRRAPQDGVKTSLTEDENRRLKKLLAESMLDQAALKELLTKKW